MTQLEKAQTIDKFFSRARESGEFGIFPVFGLSYYPTKRIQKRILLNVYGTDGFEGGYANSERYIEREKQGLRRIIPEFQLNFDDGNIETLDADFIFLKQGDVYQGILDVRKLFSKNDRDINLSLISDRALAPHKHKVTEFKDTGFVHIYTIDDDGSNWSIHCRTNQQ